MHKSSQASTAEVASAKHALGERILKARLMDVVDGGVDGDGPVMRLRSLDGSTVFDHPIPAGSFVVNCE